MDKYAIIEMLESAKINFANSKWVPELFALANEQLETAIRALEAAEVGQL